MEATVCVLYVHIDHILPGSWARKGRARAKQEQQSLEKPHRVNRSKLVTEAISVGSSKESDCSRQVLDAGVGRRQLPQTLSFL